MTRLPIACCLGLILASGCSTREPTNPLDPENPVTGGRPQWLTAVAGRGAVDLEWNVPLFDDVDSVRLVDEVTGTVLWTGRSGGDSLHQAPVPDGITRAYRFDLVLFGGRRIQVPQGAAKPGPAIPWLLDALSGRVRRLTPDARHTRLVLGVVDATGISAHPDSGSVLVLDFFRSGVGLYDRDGNRLWEDDSTFFRPLSAVPEGSGWWIGDEGLEEVLLVDHDGSVVTRWGDLGRVVDLAAGPAGRVWVADIRGRVLLVDRSQGIVAVYEDLGAAEAVAPAPQGGVWVSDTQRSRLVRLNASGDPVVDLPGRVGIVSLTADPVAPGSVWAADRGREQVVLVDPSGADAIVYPGLPAPSSVAVSPDGSEIWVAEFTRSELFRFSRDGEILVRQQGPGSPFVISVAWTPRYPLP